MSAEFSLQKIPTTLSERKETGPKPCEVYYIIELPVNAILSFIAIKNYYTYSITVDQLQYEGEPDSIEDLRPDNASCAWVPVTDQIQLMKHAHYENDAEDWHLVPIDKFNSDFKQSQLKYLRIHIWQPSPNW